MIAVSKVKVAENDLVELVHKSNKTFANLKSRNIIQQKEKNYFQFNFKKATNVGKFYLLPKIHKFKQSPRTSSNFKLWDAHKKNLEFLDHHLQPLMKQDQLYIKDTGAFLEKFKRVEEINKGAILITADVVGLLEFL